jgi:hypothetical protein
MMRAFSCVRDVPISNRLVGERQAREGVRRQRSAGRFAVTRRRIRESYFVR